MKQGSTIQKWFACLLLLIFSISITPKAYFHDLIADHKDISFCSNDHKSPCAHREGFNCHFDDLVVTSPFVAQAEMPVLAINVSYKKQELTFYSSPLRDYSLHKISRGPPTA